MNKNNISVIKTLLAIFAVGITLVFIPNSLHGADGTVTTVTTDGKYTVLAPLPCIESPDRTENGVVVPGIKCNGANGAVQDKVDFKEYVQYTINLLIGLSAVVAVVMIIWGGIEYIYSASFSSKKMGIEKVRHAIYGLLLVLTSYIILRTVDPRLVQIPNTLVPQIEIKEYLRQDATGVLMNQIIKDVANANIRGVEIGKEIIDDRKVVADKKIELAEINKRISEVDLKKPGAEKQYQDLQLSKKKVEGELIQAQEGLVVSTAKQDFNGQLMNTYEDLTTEVNGNYETTFAEKIKALDINRKNVVNLRDSKREALAKIGSVDMTEINNEAYYSMYTIDINKINVSIASAREVSQGATHQTKIVTQVVLVDGSTKTFSKPTEAKDYIKNELLTMVWAKQQIKGDSNLQSELQKQIDITTQRLDSNAILNKK